LLDRTETLTIPPSSFGEFSVATSATLFFSPPGWEPKDHSVVEGGWGILYYSRLDFSRRVVLLS
jgi:hypothetical protein